mgnify:CR=1 FL=1
MLNSLVVRNGMFDDLFDDFFETPSLFSGFVSPRLGHLSTDVKESDTGYELSIDLPGCNKDNVKISLNDGYLSVEASKESNDEKKDENGKFLRRERYSGKLSRSFYVGNGVAQDDIKASFKDGVLNVTIPKKEEEQTKYITID